MKVFCSLAILAVANAFAPQPAAFTTLSGEARSILVNEPATHRTRKATIVMDGKANGT
jgi:hypothetical protein